MNSQMSLFTDEQETERSHEASASRIDIDALKRSKTANMQRSKELVLEYLLRRGQATCREIEDKFHRGQAPIRELRLDGHIIDTVQRSGAMSYVYRGFNRRVRVTDSLKEGYYHSDHWARTAAERKSVDGFVCSQCGDHNKLETHHWSYELFNEDILFDLQTLCTECHVRLHERLRGSRIHFPRSITPVVARELGWAG